MKKYVLITGASTGIGKNISLFLAHRGFHVFATARRLELLNQLKNEASLDIVILDVTSDESIKKLHQLIIEKTQGYGIDILINNAGYGVSGPLSEVSDAELRAQFDTNVFGLMNMTRFFLKEMMNRKSGKIINISSIGGRITFPLLGAYHASKYALEALSDALRVELAPFNIDVVLIEPGSVRTDFSSVSVQFVKKPEYAESRYWPILKRADEIKKMMDDQSVHPDCVIKIVFKAISSRKPKARYITPKRTYIMLILKNILPTRVWDKMLYRFYGFNQIK